MRKYWLIFAQASTVVLAFLFVLNTFKPHWLPNNERAQPSPLASGPSDKDVVPAPVANGSFRYAVRKAMPAVVSIQTEQSEPAGGGEDPWFRFFFGDKDSEEPKVEQGSGVIVSPDGYVLTNFHVVEGADVLKVSLTDKRSAAAKIVGTDPDSDLALLKIELPNLPAIVIGNSDSLQVGDQVLAIGNPFGVGQTVTSGIISGLGRTQLGINTYENFIQTDAAINPGNSGGALIDLEGRLLGINSAIYSRSGGSMGIGFAIPTSLAMQVMEALRSKGKITRGYIGIDPQELTPELAATFGLADNIRGVIITGLAQHGAAMKAGMRPGDVLLEADGKTMENPGQLLNAVAAMQPGKAYPLVILRQGQRITLEVVPQERPKRNLSNKTTPQ